MFGYAMGAKKFWGRKFFNRQSHSQYLAGSMQKHRQSQKVNETILNHKTWKLIFVASQSQTIDHWQFAFENKLRRLTVLFTVTNKAIIDYTQFQQTLKNRKREKLFKLINIPLRTHSKAKSLNRLTQTKTEWRK